MLRHLLSLFIAIFSLSATAQMTVEIDQTVQWYVENVLLGEGVTATNITFNGQPADEVNNQCGYFASNGGYMQVESGLVMGSGAVGGTDWNGDPGVIGTINTPSDPLTLQQGDDPDLEQLSGEDINDQAILEFDFIPTGDTLRFNYVFGSEEYPEFVNSFNDAFGFFLSGPGITGAYSSPAGFPGGAANIAVLPDGTTPVTIDNVNNGNFNCPSAAPGPCTNCEYYIDNCAIQDEAFDGTTTVLEAFSLVQCGETYHIKLAIGDALDGALDSGVFLQEGSFQSSLTVSATLFSSIGPSNTGFLYENCGFGSIEFSRAGGLDDESIVELVVTGVGENGVDFTYIPDSFTFPAGDSLYYLEIYAILDGITEGLEEVTVTITNTSNSACASGSITSEFSFFVSDDPDPLEIAVTDYDIDCGEQVSIGVDVLGGYGQYEFEWSNGITTQNQDVGPGLTTEYTITVTDTCNAGSLTEALTVTVPVYPDMVVDLEDSMGLTCLEEVQISPLEVSGGNGVYDYEWTAADGQVLGDNSPSVDYIGSSTEVLTLTVTDGCFTTASDEILIDVPVIPIVIDATEDTVICLGDATFLNALVSGGEPPYEYSWSLADQVQPTVLVSPIETTVYTIAVTDLCGNTETEDIGVHVSESTALFSMTEYGYYGVELENFSTGIGNDTLYYLWDMGDGNTYDSFEVVHEYFDLDNHQISLTVSNEHGCTDSATVQVLGPPSVFVPSSFSPNNDGINDLFKVVIDGAEEYKLMIFDRWGSLVFESDDPQQAWNGQGKGNEDFYAGNDSYIYHVRARMRDGESVDKRGTITLIR